MSGHVADSTTYFLSTLFDRLGVKVVDKAAQSFPGTRHFFVSSLLKSPVDLVNEFAQIEGGAKITGMKDVSRTGYAVEIRGELSRAQSNFLASIGCTIPEKYYMRLSPTYGCDIDLPLPDNDL